MSILLEINFIKEKPTFLVGSRVGGYLLNDPHLYKVIYFPQTIRVWNALPESVMSYAEIADDCDAKQFKVRKLAKIRDQYNQVLHLTQDTTWESNKTQFNITKESQEVSHFPAGLS